MRENNDPLIQTRDYEFRLPGIKGRHLILQISDTHICAADGLSTPDEARHAGERETAWERVKTEFAAAYKEPYEQAAGLSTCGCFSRLIRYARAQAPELLLISGDALEDMHPAGERYLRKGLSDLPFPFLCTPGNHEAEELRGVWTPGVQVYEGAGFRAVAVDDRLKTVTDGSLRRLRGLCADDIPMVLMTHIPVMTEYQQKQKSIEGLDDYFVIREDAGDENAAAFCRIIREENAIRMVLCGHIHGHHVSEAAPGKYQICCGQGMTGNVNRIWLIGN